MRLSRAYDSVERLVETMGPIELKGVRVDEWQQKLKKEIMHAEKSVAVSFPKDASLEAYLQRAMQLLTLSCYSEAERVLVDSRSSDYQVSVQALCLAPLASNHFVAMTMTRRTHTVFERSNRPRCTSLRRSRTELF